MTLRKKWVLGGVAGPLALVAGVVMFVALQDARKKTYQTRCVHNLKFISMALSQYAKDNDGSYPNSLSALYPEYLPDLDAFVCPQLRVPFESERGTQHPFAPGPKPEEIDSLGSYALVPGLSANGDKDTVVAYEKEDNHSGRGRSLLYLDGRGAWEPPENWRDGPPNVNLPVELKKP
ncbi:MAG: hypothetical protein WC655_00930 [Candidatus Hydrogenedentales bacterium]|jgi:hypothetical protein